MEQTIEEQLEAIAETHKQELIAYELKCQNLTIELNELKGREVPGTSEQVVSLTATIDALKKIVIDIAGEDYLKHKGF